MTVRLLIVTVLLIGLSAHGLSSQTNTGQAAQPTGQGAQSAPEDPPVFRIGVDVIRVDVVVTDKDGRPVTDLTPADFEIRQDGEPQQVVAARFVAVEPPPAPAPLRARTLPASTTAPTLGRSPGTAADVQRTIAIVVDDLGMSWESMEPTRRALRKFVDESVQAGDLVAMLRTSVSVSALQQFTTDRRLLHSAIDQLRFTAISRRGVEPFTPVNEWITLMNGSGDSGPLFGAQFPDLTGRHDQLREVVSTSGTLGAMHLVLKGIGALPGRKALVLVSEGFALTENDPDGTFQPSPVVRARLDAVLDAAMRMGIVIYTVDPRGLQTGGLRAEDNTKALGASGTSGEGLTRAAFLHHSQETLQLLADETGGLAMLNTNDLAGALRRVSDDQRGYYVLGYAPPPGTFAAPGKTARYHRLSVKVKRPGLKVRTRKGFLGIPDRPLEESELTANQELYRAATSPFEAADLPLRVTVLPGFRPGESAFVRALLHVQGRGLEFRRNEAGQELATIDVLGLVFDEWGAAIAGRTAVFEVARNENADASDAEGVVFSLTVPVKRPGGYQVRFAIRDQASGALGAAGQFVEVGDVEHGALALSGLLLGEESGGARTLQTPQDGHAEASGGANPALRVFERGTRLVYACEIYNAKGPVETRVSVWRNGRPFFVAAPAVLQPPQSTQAALKAAGGLKLGDRMPPGEYMLQLAATARDTERKQPSTAVQWVDFTVR